MANNAVRLPYIGRVIYSFHSQLEGELALTNDDLVLITQIVDRYWFYGQLGNDKGRFPQKNVTAVTHLPPALPGQPYFAALGDFDQQQVGDLSFKRGEILVGLNRVDTNWWYGRSADGREGIFPTSLAWQVDLRPVQSASNNGTLGRRRAVVLQHLVAQLPDELDLRKGDEVIVTGTADDGWLCGESQGRTGIFPSGFVSFIAEDSPRISQELIVAPTISEPATTSYTIKEVENYINGRPYGIACYDFHGQQDDELDFYTGQTVYLLKHVNAEWMEGEVNGRKGIFPTLFVQIVVDCDGPSTNNPSKSHDFLLDSDKSNNLLLDFDPLLTNDIPPKSNLSSNEINNRRSSATTWGASAGSAQMSLDSFITRNLNLLESTSSSQACEKQRPASWSQTLTTLQIEYSKQPERKLPPIPPRRQEIQSFNEQTTHHHVVSAQQSVQPTVETLDSELVENETIISVGGNTNDGACGSISLEMNESGASRMSYTRPAPPPPTDYPHPRFSRQDSSDSIGSHLHSATQPLRPAPQIPTDSGEDRVEGRRQRIEKERQRKMEEEQLRDLEMRKKVKEQREKVITELLVTEREYCRDLRLTCQVFKLHDLQYLEDKGVDVATIFGNILEVITLSERFIDLLNKCTTNCEEDHPTDYSIGKSFIQTEPEFRRVYGSYCINHDNAQFLLEKYENVPSVSTVLEEGVATLRQQIVCFNMGSIIIKPVQRIMKYSLILGELIKYTENDHRDKSNLVLAMGLMSAVATFINESKRKKEIVLKYRDSGHEEKLSTKISRLSMHSVAKKSSRIGMLLKTSLGIAPTTKDTAFEEVEVRFGELFRVVQTALRDITAVCDQLKITSKTHFEISEAFALFYGEANRVPLIDNFRTAQRMIYSQHWNSFDAYVIQHVRNPLTALCDACTGPERLIVKRRDKLLDSNIASERLARNRDPAMRRTLEEEENLARNTHLALNSQLMEELPIITEHGYNIYRRCISSFLHARKLLVGRITKSLLDLNEISDIANLQGEIDEDFYVAYGRAIERLSRVTFINKSFRRTSSVVSTDGPVSPNDTTPARNRLSSALGNHSPGEGIVVQSRETVNLLRSKYQPEQLYMVTGRCDIKESMDLSANSGLIVGVIKREDPMGNTGRWFVDAGEVRGFLPAKHLSLVSSPTSGQASRLASSHSTQLLRPESSASLGSNDVSGASCNSTSLESLKETLVFDEDPTSTNMENIYDLPPSYEEALGAEGAHSPHRYCEIDDLTEECDEKEEGATCHSSEKAESPIYAVIEDIIPSMESKDLPTTENNVYKVEYEFRKRTNLEIDLHENELVTVLCKHDEAGNSEWWLVENDEGIQGYAPAAYLTQLATDTANPKLFG
ncbi:dynamin-binding protein-like [Daphnia carinata]|uniref:dynamin-binding protein-like n=1 Tax=Daphnia carinata TaxID=120202 RepID=UPI00257A0C6C|nr:dynamin-binding protein-like [Daphnia carinata]